MERMFRPGPERMPQLEPSPWHTVYAHGTPAGRSLAQANYDPTPHWNVGPYRQDVPKHGRLVHGR